MAPPAIVRKQQYCTNGRLEIRTVGTEDWHKPPAYELYLDDGPCNVVRPWFRPGSIQVFQQAAKPTFDSKGLVASAAYMWMTTFNVADLQDIRVKESQYGYSETNATFRTRIEILAVCKAPPTGSGLVVPEGVHTSDVYHKTEATSEPMATSIALASLSDRWASGEQEIHLTVTRTTRTERKPGKNKPQHRKEIVVGPRVWVWNAFLAFMCGLEWEAPNKDTVVSAAKKGLMDIVESKLGNPYAEFQKRDGGWVLIKTKPQPLRSSASVSEEEQQKRAAHFTAPNPVAGPSITRTSVPVAVSSALSSSVSSPSASASTAPPQVVGSSMSIREGKRRAVEDVQDAEPGSKESEIRSQLERELVEARLRKEWARDERMRWAEKAEKAAEEERELQLRLDTLGL